MQVVKNVVGRILFGVVLAVACPVVVPRAVTAIEVGEPAPDFKLPATTGADIALSDFKGKKWVFLEFYGLDFQPT